MSGRNPLSPADDLPIHQVAQPFQRVGTSDRHFYDRYYFNLHGCNDEVFAAFGFANYPNLGVADGFLVVTDARTHRVVRASRELGADRTDTSVGPLRIEVIEGLRRLRLVCELNDWGVALDAVWEASFPAQLEPPHFVRQLERVITDTSRYTQTGRWTGTLTVGDRTFTLTPDRWWGGRDRSWGVRPVGEPEPPGIAASLPFAGFMHNWAPMQFEDMELLYFVMEDGNGNRSLEEAVRVWPESAGRAPEELGRPVHELELRPGTQAVAGGRIRFPEAPGGELVVEFETLIDLYLGVGTGYTGDDGWYHGQWQGELAVEGVAHDLTTKAGHPAIAGAVDALARFRCGDRVGYGVFEYSFRPPIPQYGLK